MPLFKKSAAEKFTPKKIQFSKYYKSTTQGGKLGDNILMDVKSSLRRSGYTDAQIARMITADEPLPVDKMKQIVSTLNKDRVYGFEKDPDQSVKKYLNKERVKAQTIAHIRKEHILEAAEENLASAGTTSLNQRAIGPNSSKAGQASVLSRRRGTAAAYSISGKSESTRTSSLTSRTGFTSISRPGVGKAGSIGGGISIKPKF
ncbi:MAG: hypothetical protein WCT26_01660 [Candidatus Buchananbacteria bacterium]|jgi:hypothetical protein